MTIHMRYDSSYLNLPHNGSLPRGGGLGWGQGYKFQKTYAFAWFGKRSIVENGQIRLATSGWSSSWGLRLRYAMLPLVRAVRGD